MNKNALLIGALGLLSLPALAQKKVVATKGKPAVKVNPLIRTQIDSVSYSIGLEFGNQLKSQGFDSLNYNILVKALKDASKGATPIIAREQGHTAINNYIQKINEKKMQNNKVAGEQFLAENKSKPGVTALPSGLQYVILKEGTGEKPTINDKVKTHYHGTLIDGTVFDSSVERGEPISFPVSGVIKGWTEALQLMPVGSKWKLFIPSSLAYGDRSAGPKIGPGSTLVFEVELLAIEK